MKTASLTAAALMVWPAFAQAEAVTVQSCDRSITFPETPQAAVSNDVNITEMMLVLGLREHMIGYTGISAWRTLDPEMRSGVAELPELSTIYPTREVLVGAGADFLFAGWNYGLKVGGEVTPATLEPFGITVYELTESCTHIMDKPKASLDDMYNDIRNLGAIFRVPERADALIAGWQAEVELLTAEVDTTDPIKAFVYDSGEDSPFTAGRYAMPTALIEAAGGSNVMDSFEKSWATVGWEEVIDAAPEVIVIVNYGEVTADQKRAFMMNNPAFADIPAVVNDNFVTLEYVEATPGPRNIAAIGKLANAFAVADR
ncbi:ABC transporter substrate-binding protein [Loktanella sp. S4079]|uniref:ABC transporter substrate-binding protein n=1 Tax=Loktanella sp. S4079 TaxID=579483 RepID=UPI0005FA53E6|nr:iron ABC transporter substrate-binding protein [Loktanella sp. S4079]